MEHPFLRNEMLWGRAAQARLTQAHVLLLGLGGVGSYAAECLARSGIGGPLRAGEVAARVQAAPGVLRVREVDLRTSSAGCYQNAEGDIRLPRRGIPHLKELRVTCLPVERTGR